MPSGRTVKLVVICIALATALTACSAGGSATAPAGVRIDGVWRFDQSASDDPQKVIDQLRAAAEKNSRRRPATQYPPTMGRHRGPPQEPSPTQQEDEVAAGLRPTGPEAAANSPTMHAVMSFITRGDYLTVRHDSDRFVLDYGGPQRSFTPGAKSVVSADTGVADQVTGWKGKEYVIDIKPQVGPSITEVYSLSEDQQHLIARLHVAGSELPKVDLKRVYNRASEVAPRALPTND